MSTRKKRYKANPCLSRTGSKDSFTPIYSSMVESEAFKKLKPTEKMMFVCCALQVKSSDGKRCLYEHCKANSTETNDNYFVFPAAHMKKYGIEQGKGSKALKKLCESGFIKVIEANKHRRQINVYTLSDGWKTLE